MASVRSASWLLAIWLPASVSALACTRDNPAFNGDGDDVLDEGDTRPGTEGSDTDTGTAAECVYVEGKDLLINLDPVCAETNDTTMRFERSFRVKSETANGWQGGWCQVGDASCAESCPDASPQDIVLEPFDVSGLAGEGACLRIIAEQRDPSSSSCEFDAIGIWAGSKPIVMASNGFALIGEALADAGLSEPVPAYVEPGCECVEECCETRGDYRFDVGEQKIPVGAPVKLDNYSYDFYPLRAYNPTGCSDDLQQAWAMRYLLLP